VATVLARALRLRCPRCGRARLFSGWFAMDDPCPACGLRYEREQGYFVGAIYVNYALTTAVTLGTVLGLDALVGLTLMAQLGLGVALGALVPFLFFRYSRSLWLAIDFLVSRVDTRRARRNRRT
jgi:uncharacterized protein (DUF983 family)